MSGASFIPSPGVDDDAFTVCTSSTRPYLPFVGQMIYETDTQMTLQYYGTGWGPIWSQPWGQLAYAEITGDVSFTTITDIAGLSVTVTVPADRRIRLMAHCGRVGNTTTANQEAIITIREGSTYLAWAHVSEGEIISNGGGNAAFASIVITPSAGAHTYKVSAHRDSGSDTHVFGASAAAPGYILIEDLGPASTTIGTIAYPSNTNATNYQICTSSTRPSSPYEGMMIYETDTDIMYAYSGSAWEHVVKQGVWTSYTPTLTQSGAVTKTVTYARYCKVGRLVTVNLLLSVTGTGTAANPVLVGLPFTAAQGGNIAAGTGFVYDASVGFNFPLIVLINSTTIASGISSALNNSGAFIGQAGFTAALASGDVVSMSFTYEAAS